MLVDTPHGSVLARARLSPDLDPAVVVGQHGWWQACAALGLPGYPPYGPESANMNLVLPQEPADPVSGSSPLRSSVCDVRPRKPAHPAPVRVAATGSGDAPGLGGGSV